jgi:tetratricopeptide (TPR) repeat protein
MRASILAFTLFAALSARANLDLTLKADHIRNEKKHERQTVHVTLAETWVRWDDGKASGTYDLRTRRVIRVDREEHELYDHSLFAEVRGREVELENRVMLGKMLETAKASENLMALTLSEHALSLRSNPPAPPDIAPQTRDGERRFIWREEELAAWSLDHYPATESQHAQFVRFVRLVYGGHPAILEELQKSDGIPKRIRISDQMAGETRIVITEAKQSPDAPYPAPPADAKEKFADPALGTAIAAVRTSTPQSRDAALRAILDAASAAADAKRPLEGFLGFLELRLMRGPDMPKEFDDRKDAMVANEDVQALLGALQPKSEEEAKAAVETMTRLMKPAGPKAYVAAIFRANIAASLGDADSAVHDFRDALAKNPFLTGVWKDLGDLQWKDYHAPAAWQSYETARLIAPDHPLLKEVAETEARLLREHPEYF